MDKPLVKQKDMDDLKRGQIRSTPMMDMTLRDYFAAEAMHGYISTAGAPCIVGGLDGAEDELAKQSYKMADAMLRARGQ